MTALGRATGAGPSGTGRVPANELFADLPPTRRRSLHRAAAEVVRGDSAWLHRVAAATSVDEPLAAGLEAAALATAPTGPGRPGPAQLLQWASDLSGDQAGRERRLLVAAIHQICAGEIGPATLWHRVAACAPSGLRSCALSGRALSEGRRLEAEHHLHLALGQPDGRPDSVVAIAHGMKAALRVDAALGQQAVEEAAAGLAACEHDRGLIRWLTRLLAAGRCYADGPSAALDTLVIENGEERSDVDRREPATLVALGAYRVLCGDPAGAITDLSELLALADRPLSPELEVSSRQWLALACQLAGAWREADRQAKSAIDTARSAGAQSSGAPHAISAMLFAYRGAQVTAEEELRSARDLGGPLRPDDAVLADLAEVTIAHSRTSLHPKHQALQRLANGGDAARKYRALWLPVLAETLVEHDEEPGATTALAELLALAERVPYLILIWFRLSGRIQERRRNPVAAARLYQAARDLPPEGFAVPLQAGLMEHCHGRLLCGLGDGDDGPALLNQAVARLTAAGAMPYARRAAADHSARHRVLNPEPRHPTLTKRERAVAHLVAGGLTNQEAAARLYVSVKTVEYHLAQIYGKLGITSRRQLARFANTMSQFGDDATGASEVRRN
jgi:DNA-binding CsgD family transcriptional regulator